MLLPEPALIEAVEIANRERGQVVKPIGDGASHATVEVLTSPLERVVTFAPTRLTLIPDVEHRPVEQMSVCAFLVLIHARATRLAERRGSPTRRQRRQA